MKKIAVIGNAAGGKSTLCRTLNQTLDIPLLEIDKIYWTADWHVAPADAYNTHHDAFIAGDTWLVDGGGSWDSVIKRLAMADTIIFLDMPLWRHYWWVTKRQFWTRKGHVSWRLVPKLYQMIWQMHQDMRPKIIAELARLPNTTEVIVLRSPAMLSAFCLAARNATK